MAQSVLSLHDVTKRFKQGDAVITVLGKNNGFGISQTFCQGMSYALMGTSGAGKSTLLHIIAGLEAPTSGSVNFNGIDLVHMPVQRKEQFFTKHIGLIFQLPYLISELTVLENVMVKGILEGINWYECEQKGYMLLEQLGLQDKALSAPQTLSGGQQQRVAIARALLNQPEFLLADEPTGNLDEKTGRMLIDLLLHYQQEYDMGLIISSHDRDVASRMQERLIVKDGYLTREGI